MTGITFAGAHHPAGRYFAVRLRRICIALAIVPGLFAAAPALTPAANSASGCADPTPYRWLPTTPQTPAASTIDVSVLGKQKQDIDGANLDLRADLASAAAISGDLATKYARMALVKPQPTGTLTVDEACSGVARRGSLLEDFRRRLATDASATAGVSSGPGYAWLNGLDQQGQATSYFCGPATVSESAYTTGAPVDQWTAAAYMGTNSSTGTDAGAETAGMQHFVGYPNYGWYWYYWVNVPDTPASSDYDTFVTRVKMDVGDGMTVAGDAYEVPYGPRLNGHPTQLTIFHYFEIGGWENGTSIYYADSATTVWAGVPPFSWFDGWTMVVILGGRGYIW